MSLTDMIVAPISYDDDEVYSWTVKRGSRIFVAQRNDRGDWEVRDLGGTEDELVLDVSGDLSGSLEYIESLFH